MEFFGGRELADHQRLHFVTFLVVNAQWQPVKNHAEKLSFQLVVTTGRVPRSAQNRSPDDYFVGGVGDHEFCRPCHAHLV